MHNNQSCDENEWENKDIDATSEYAKREHDGSFEQMPAIGVELNVDDAFCRLKAVKIGAYYAFRYERVSSTRFAVDSDENMTRCARLCARRVQLNIKARVSRATKKPAHPSLAHHASERCHYNSFDPW